MIKGTQVLPDNSVLSGHFLNDKLEGTGKLTTAHHSEKQGVFHQGALINSGTYKISSGVKFEAEFHHNKVHKIKNPIKDSQYYTFLTCALLNDHHDSKNEKESILLSRGGSSRILCPIVLTNALEKAILRVIEKTNKTPVAVSSMSDLTDLDLQILLKTMTIISELKSYHTVSTKDIEQIIQNKSKAPVFLNAGSRRHAMTFLVFENNIYVCNKGSGSPYDSKASEPGHPRGLAIEPFALPTSETDQIKFIKGLMKNEFEHAKDVYSFIKKENHLKTNSDTVFQDMRPQTRQRRGNCWLMSPLAGLYGLIILNYKQEIMAMPENQRQTLLKEYNCKTVDRLAMRLGRKLYKEQLSKHVQIRDLAQEMGKDKFNDLIKQLDVSPQKLTRLKHISYSL